MSIFSYLSKRSNTAASVAKERLQIIISHERSQRNTPDFLPKLQEEIFELIAKYIPITRDKVIVSMERSGDSSVLELNVMVPDEALEEA